MGMDWCWPYLRKEVGLNPGEDGYEAGHQLLDLGGQVVDGPEERSHQVHRQLLPLKKDLMRPFQGAMAENLIHFSQTGYGSGSVYDERGVYFSFWFIGRLGKIWWFIKKNRENKGLKNGEIFTVLRGKYLFLIIYVMCTPSPFYIPWWGRAWRQVRRTSGRCRPPHPLNVQ